MVKHSWTFAEIPLDRIFLDHENPRHEPFDTQAEVIEYLCQDEEVAQLARDIAQRGLSPFDRFGVMKIDPDDPKSAYFMTEGNRRLCALKLLADPDLAPPERKSFFEKQAANWMPITSVECWVSDNKSEISFWLKRRHHGFAGGVGQKPWNADQKARHSGNSSRDRIALAFLDWAEQGGLITKEQRKGKLTTVTRYVGNPILREAMGIDASGPDEVQRNRSEDDFKLLSQKFISDMLENNPKVHSRNNSDKIVEYARELTALDGQSHERIDAEPFSTLDKKAKQKRRKKPGKVRSRRRLPYDDEIAAALKDKGTWKLQSLYHSICDVQLSSTNTPLLSVGAWSFFETLTAAMGRKPSTDFVTFLSNPRLNRYGLGDKWQIKPLRDALNRIQDFGNTTKHHDTSAAFNGEQLANDLETLRDLILKCVEDVPGK